MHQAAAPTHADWIERARVLRVPTRPRIVVPIDAWRDLS
jgi:hypothetical protein